MKTGQGKVEEILLDGSLRIQCSPDLIPSPGQYLLAHKNASDSPLPVPVFFMDSSPNGYRCAPLTVKWQPGDLINFRGPIGHGFQVPSSARKITLVAYEKSIAHLHGLIALGLKQNAEIVLISDSQGINLPEIIEIQPLQSLIEVINWADYSAIDIARENLNQLNAMLGKQDQTKNKFEAQILIHAPMPCGGVAECGVCALNLGHEWKMICKEGPVFNLSDVF
jgi:hypothetical protein